VFLLPVFGFIFNRRSTVKLPKIFHPGSTRIRCPRCGWQPAKTDMWMCSPGCGHVWNTFDTHGICPGCDKHWSHTACLKCDAWCQHEEWYEQSQD
jgi:hypothetical protein